MTAPLVIVARSEDAPALRKRLGHDPVVAVFPESESLRALHAILARRPKILALDPGFIMTARGAAIVAQVKADPHLAGVDVRVLAHDAARRLLLLTVRVGSSEVALLAASRPLDHCGTRQAPRVPINDHVEVVINGERSQLVNLSATGAQVLVPKRLRPNQAVRFILLDGSVETRLRAQVAWSVAELVVTTVRYRAGLVFIDPDPQILEAFCLQHGPRHDAGLTAPSWCAS